MPRLFLSLLFLVALGTNIIRAQDLHVYYDAFADSVYYIQNGKRIDRPVVRKGNNVVLHVNNYNNYLYNVQVKNQNSTSNIAQGMPIDSDLLGSSGEFNPLGFIFGGDSPFGGVPGLSGLSGGSGAANTAAERERQARISEIEKQVSIFNSAMQRAEARAEEIGSIQKEVQMALEAQQIQTFAAEEMQRLRFNPHLEPRQIKELSQEYVSRIFRTADPEQIDLSAVLDKTDAKADFSGLKQSYEKQVALYAKDVAVMKGVNSVLEVVSGDFPESNLGRFQKDAEKVVAVAEENLNTYQGNIEKLEAESEDVIGLDVRELADLRINYIVTMKNDFSKTFRQPASSDKMDLQLIFTPIDSVNISGVATKAVPPIEVKVYGGLQVNAGLGLSFGQFFNRPQSYFVRDSLIFSSDKDAFTPFLTSFVNFYPQARGETSLGGSFGVGIPLGGAGSSLEAITFFLGPSLILGRSRNIVLSGGLMGGRVSRLANGYSVGDRFEAQSDFLQTEMVYTLGYSVGLSFNLLGKN
jgi:hypothetical protein